MLSDVEFDGVVGISSGGVPLATLISDELDKNFSIYVPKKHVHTEKEKTTGFIGQNMSSIVGKDVIIVDDVMTSGNSRITSYNVCYTKLLRWQIIRNFKPFSYLYGVFKILFVKTRNFVKNLIGGRIINHNFT